MKYQSEGDNIFLHINSCPSFQYKKGKILTDTKSSQLKPRQVFKLKLDQFRSHFSIIANNFKHHFDRVNSEAYLIKTMKPS